MKTTLAGIANLAKIARISSLVSFFAGKKTLAGVAEIGNGANIALAAARSWFKVQSAGFKVRIQGSSSTPQGP